MFTANRAASTWWIRAPRSLLDLVLALVLCLEIVLLSVDLLSFAQDRTNYPIGWSGGGFAYASPLNYALIGGSYLVLSIAALLGFLARSAPARLFAWVWGGTIFCQFATGALLAVPAITDSSDTEAVILGLHGLWPLASGLSLFALLHIFQRTLP